MTEMPKPATDEFLTELQDAVRKILKGGKGIKPAEKLAAISAGVKIAAIKHKVTSGEDTEGFFK
jgi:hypothetical protein